MGQVIGVNDFNYRSYRKVFSKGMFNGAYYYAKELEENIIPLVKTDRHWDLLGMNFTRHFNHSVIFVHHNLDWDKTYGWMDKYNDIVLVASTYPTLDWAKSKGYKVIFLPLSIDVEYVKRFMTEKTKDACYAGNRWAFKREQENKNIPKGVVFPPPNLERDKLLEFMAPFRKCYAIGRCALEAMALGCEIMPFLMDRYPDPNYWKILENKDAAKILQTELNKIDNPCDF